METKEGSADGKSLKKWSQWESLSPDVLSLIFVRVLPADALLRTVPFVCKAWRDVIRGPYCWADVDLEQWARRVSCTIDIDAAVRQLVRRSAGTLQRLCVFKLGNFGFSFVANSVKFLKVLQIPMSSVMEQMIEKHVESLRLLTILDISYCLGITSKGIEVIGKNCKSLVQLRRNMPPPQPEISQDNGYATKVDELEALAVANTMCCLEHLELAYGQFSDNGLDAILTKCTALRVLDVRGCWNVKLEGDVDGKCDLIPCFKDPWFDEFEYDDGEEEDDGDDHALDAVLAALNDNEQAHVDGNGGGGGGGGQMNVVVISDDDEDEDHGIVQVSDNSDESWG